MAVGFNFKAFDRSALLFKAVKSALPFKAVRSAFEFKAVRSALVSTSELTVWISSQIVGSAYILSLAEISAHAVPAGMASMHLYIL